MKRIPPTVTITFMAAILACSWSAMAQQESTSETRLRDDARGANQELRGVVHFRGNSQATVRHEQTPKPQPEPEPIAPLESEGSGLAQPPRAATITVRVEPVPTPEPVSEREASQLVGKSALSSRGEEIGEIHDVVRSRINDELHAVVDVGDVLGVGELPVALPIEPGGIDRYGNLRVHVSWEQLQRMRKYDPRKYQ